MILKSEFSLALQAEGERKEEEIAKFKIFQIFLHFLCREKSSVLIGGLSSAFCTTSSINQLSFLLLHYAAYDTGFRCMLVTICFTGFFAYSQMECLRL